MLYIYFVSYLFNMLVLGFCAFIHTFCIFNHANFEYSYHDRFLVFNVFKKKIIIFNFVIKIFLHTNSFLDNFIILIFPLSCI